jgi:MFS family permease
MSVRDAGARSALSCRGFRSLLLGQGVSAFGDWMVTVAMMALVLDLTGSSTAVAGILVLRLMPTAIAGPLATRAVQRWDQRRAMLATDLARAGVVVMIPWVRGVWWVYLWAFLLEVASLVFLPARDASVPLLVPDDELETANGLLLASSYGLIPLGAGAFAVVSALVPGDRGARLPMVIVFAFDAATYLWSYLMISGIAGLRDAPRMPQSGAAERRPFLHTFKMPMVRLLVGPAFLASLGIGCLFSLGIVFVREVLGASNAEFSVLVVLFGVGAIIGLATLRLAHAQGVGAARATLAGQGAVIGGMSLAPSIGFAFAGAVGFGAFTAATLTVSMSLLQQQVAPEERVSAFAVFHVVIRASLALAAIGAGIAADVLRGVRWPLFGYLAPSRVVLLVAGTLVVISTALVHLRARFGELAASSAR